MFGAHAHGTPTAMMAGMFEFLRRRQPTPPAPAAPPVAVAPTPVRPDLPRYPPFLQGLPVVASAQLLATQADLVAKLRYGIGCTPAFFQLHVLPVVDRYAAFVHLLPASEAHHHRGAGGLLHHGLEVAFWAGQASAGKVFAMDREPAVRRVHEPLWRLAAALAGLCHDIGKPVSDLSVTNRDGTLTWSPMQETIADWAARHAIDRYFLHWRERRHNRHESAGLLAVERVLGPDLFARLYQADPEIGHALIDAVAGANEAATLTQLVSNADRASVERDLKTNRIDPQATALGVPIERYLLDAMARLVRAGTWGINTPGARLWMLGDSLYVVWPQGGDEVVGMLAADRVPGIPRHPDTLADLLIERGYASPPREGDGVRRYWRLAPAPLARDGTPVTLTLLRLTSPHHVLAGPAPAPVDLVGEPAVPALIPSAGRGPGHPGAVPQADTHPRSRSTDSAAVDDADARRDEAARLGLEWADIDADGPGDSDRAYSLDPTDALTPAAPDDPRMAAEAWFQVRRPGAGACLLLDLAAAIRTGVRTPEAVLYLPDQPGNPVWVRVPDGLDGFGVTVEAQIAALWDDALIAVDILKPYLHVRVIDGIRGVALTVEASGYFAALLPTGTLDRCRPREPAEAARGAEEPAVGPEPWVAEATAPKSPRGPAARALVPPASSPAPTAAQSPSAVAKDVLTRVRAAHAATAGEGTVILLTPADLAAAAQAAGLKLPSLKRALMHRPGCRLTTEGGAEVSAE